MVGMLGSASERVAAVTASARQPASPDIVDRRDSGAKVDLHLPTEQIGERRPATTIGHVGHIDAGHHLEQFAGHMGRCSGSSRRHVDLAWIGFGVSDELVNRLVRYRWVYHHDVSKADDAPDRPYVADEIEV